MEIYLTEQIFDSLLNSLAIALTKYYETELPVLIGVGISGIELVGRLPSVLKAPTIETYVCDVTRKNGKITGVVNFPYEKIKGKNVLLAYVRVDTGKTFETLIALALNNGAKEVKTMSIAVRKGTECFPHFFCFMLGKDDNLYLFLEDYPPDLESSYPPVITTPDPLLRKLRKKDAEREWFKCGDTRIDKFGCGDFLYFMKLSRNAIVYILDTGKEILGAIYFSIRRKNVWIDTLAIKKGAQGRGLGTKLILFFIDWCRFNGIESMSLDAFQKRERFYKELGFRTIDKFVIPNYGRFARMKRKVF